MLNPNFLLRKMAVQDIDAVMQIELSTFTLPWSRESYLSELDNKYANYFIVDFEGEIAGYGGIWVVFEEAHITNVAVGENFRGCGFGRALMTELERHARQKKAGYIFLEVRASNNVALEMYKRLGYRVTGLRKGYYSDNQEDALKMIKYLL